MKRQLITPIKCALIMIMVTLFFTGCGSEADAVLTTEAPVDQVTVIEDYVEAYESVDYRRMWKAWPEETFGGKVEILADMKKDIFRNYYSSKASLKLETGEILAGSEEDRQIVIQYFNIADVKYVTDLYRMDYKAVVEGGKREGDTYKEGVIYAFRNQGKWYVFDN